MRVLKIKQKTIEVIFSPIETYVKPVDHFHLKIVQLFLPGRIKKKFKMKKKLSWSYFNKK